MDDDLIIKATCAVIIDGKIKGTAWMIHRDGYLLTAGHLLGTNDPLKKVEICFSDSTPCIANKVVWCYDKERGVDFAILKIPIKDNYDYYPLPIKLSRIVKGNLKVYGYGKSLFDISIGNGTFLGFYDRQNKSSNRLFKYDSKQLGEGGYSGGAVISEELQAVVAIQISATKNTTGAERDTVLSMPLYRIAEEYRLLSKKHSLNENIFIESKFISNSKKTKIHWGEAPDISVFFGRTKELELLENWVLKDKCRIVSIIGMKGIGKTRLSVKLGRGGIGKTDLSAKFAMGIQEKFDFVIWKKLLNAPTLSEILVEIIKTISNQEKNNVEMDTEKQINNLLVYLQKYRCLLIFDNFESILSNSIEGEIYKDGYKDYGLFLNKIGEVSHKSCLIITSREKPLEIAKLEGKNKPIRTLSLGGLDKNEGKQLIETIATLSGEDDDWNTLINFYNGNPLALELASKHIDEVFFGDIKAFLSEKKPVFEDLKELLNWHYSRLSDLEKEILYWFSINREHISYKDLQEDLLSPTSKKQLSSTLQSLQRRLPIEKSMGLFSLQPVLIEYFTDKFIENITSNIINLTFINDKYIPLEFNLFSTHAIIKASSKEYIRESQIRLFIEPIIEYLQSHFFDKNEIIFHLIKIIAKLQKDNLGRNNYITGNILNLLIYLKFNFNGANFSFLSIYQAYLQNQELQNVNFSGVEFRKCIFTQTLSNVLSLDFNKEGNLLATSDTNGEIRVWNFKKGKLLFILKKHFGWAWTVKWHPLKQILASCSIDSTIKLWDIETEECFYELKGHDRGIWTLAFNPNGEILASAGEDKTIKLWSIKSNSCIQTLKGHTNWIWSLEFSSSGNLLASAGDDCTIRIWNINTGLCISTLSGHSDQIRDIVFSPNENYLISASRDSLVKIWDLNTNQCIKTLKKHKNGVRSIAISNDGGIFASGSDDQTIRLWNFFSFESINVFKHSGKVRSLKFSRDNTCLVSGGDDQSIKIWDINTGKSINTLKGYTNWIWAILFNKIGNLFITASEDKSVRVWDLKTEKCIKTLYGYTDGVRFLSFSLDESMLASGSEDQAIKLWRIDKDKWISRDIPAKGIRSVAFSPNGKFLVGCGDTSIIQIWDTKNLVCIKEIEGYHERIRAVNFNPNGEIFITCGDDYNIKIWDLHTGNNIRILKGHTGKVRSSIFSPDGKYIISGSEDYSVRIWDSLSGELLYTLEGHTNCVYAVAINLSGDIIASCGLDHTIRLWGIDSKKCLHTLEGHTNEVLTISFNPQSDILISGSQDETIKFWNIRTGKCIKTLRPDRPYEKMNINNIIGVSEAEIEMLKALGAEEKI